jgi:hypothetical protein
MVKGELQVHENVCEARYFPLEACELLIIAGRLLQVYLEGRAVDVVDQIRDVQVLIEVNLSQSVV